MREELKAETYENRGLTRDVRFFIKFSILIASGMSVGTVQMKAQYRRRKRECEEYSLFKLARVCLLPNRSCMRTASTIGIMSAVAAVLLQRKSE